MTSVRINLTSADQFESEIQSSQRAHSSHAGRGLCVSSF